MDTLLQESWFIWGLVLTLVFPVTILTVNEISLKVRPRSIELSKIIQEIRNLILPMLALRLLLVQVLGLPLNGLMSGWSIRSSGYHFSTWRCRLSILPCSREQNRGPGRWAFPKFLAT
ncbi:MAG: hypothetical protein AAFR99_16675 [Cyanobacteria bacterium J06629_9]